MTIANVKTVTTSEGPPMQHTISCRALAPNMAVSIMIANSPEQIGLLHAQNMANLTKFVEDRSEAVVASGHNPPELFDDGVKLTSWVEV